MEIAKFLGGITAIAILLGGCSGSTTDDFSKPKITEAVTSGDKTAVLDIAGQVLTATAAYNTQTLCRLVLPSQQKTCRKYLVDSEDLADGSLKDFQVGQVQIQGEQALATVMGTVCDAEENCTTQKNPSAGLESSQNFEANFKKAMTSGAGEDYLLAFVRMSNQWYYFVPEFVSPDGTK